MSSNLVVPAAKGPESETFETFPLSDGRIDRWTDGLMDGWTDGLMNR